MKILYGSCGNSIGVEQLTLTFIYGAVTGRRHVRIVNRSGQPAFIWREKLEKNSSFR